MIKTEGSLLSNRVEEVIRVYGPVSADWMMKKGNRLYLLRHAHTRIDPSQPASSWVLSEQGLKQAQAARDEMREVFDCVYSSEERKAIQTAEFFLLSPEESIHTCPHLNELNRDTAPHLSSDDYYEAVRRALTTPTLRIHNWETAQDAHRRFSQGIKQINSQNSDARILVVTHGLVLSLFFAKALSQIDTIYERWRKLRFCSWGIIEDERIIKDIV